MAMPAESLSALTPDQAKNTLSPTLPLEAGTGPLSAARILDLTAVLQSSLNMPDLIALFAQELDREVAQAGLRYASGGATSAPGAAPDDFDLLVGREAPHRLSYQLEILDHPLGEILVMGDTPFDEQKVELVESMLAVLLYPLRNALLYARALRSALKDPLTGLNNREAMESYLGRELASARRHRTPLALVLLDIDHFKQVNDTYGHLVGDTVLTEVAHKLIECSRDSDIVFRYGGEEFVVVLANTDLAGAERVAERIRAAVAAHIIDSSDGRITVTVSAGVTVLSGDENPREFLDRADRLMYAAKRGGRNRVEAG